MYKLRCEFPFNPTFNSLSNKRTRKSVFCGSNQHLSAPLWYNVHIRVITRRGENYERHRRRTI